MISLKVDNLKGELNQQLYDEYINLIDVHSLTCTCGNHDNVIHGYYRRKVRTDKTNTELRIVRVKCKCCGKTHADSLTLSCHNNCYAFLLLSCVIHRFLSKYKYILSIRFVRKC